MFSNECFFLVWSRVVNGLSLKTRIVPETRSCWKSTCANYHRSSNENNSRSAPTRSISLHLWECLYLRFLTCENCQKCSLCFDIHIWRAGLLDANAHYSKQTNWLQAFWLQAFSFCAGYYCFVMWHVVFYIVHTLIDATYTRLWIKQSRTLSRNNVHYLWYESFAASRQMFVLLGYISLIFLKNTFVQKINLSETVISDWKKCACKGRSALMNCLWRHYRPVLFI